MDGDQLKKLPLEQAVSITSIPSLIDSVSNAILITDLSGNIVFWNKEAEHTYLWSKGEVQGRNMREVLPLDGHPRIDDILEQVRKDGSWHGRLKFRRRDGSPTVSQASISTIRDNEDSVIGLISISRDISSEARAKEEAREREAKFGQLFNTMEQGVVFRDGQEKLCP